MNEWDGREQLSPAGEVNSITQKRLLLVSEARVGQAGTDDLLEKLTGDGGGVVVSAKRNDQRAQAGDGAVEEQCTIPEGDIVLSEPRVLVESANEALIGTVVAALGEWGLSRQR